VAVNERVTNTQLAQLADAFNARLRSGLGDPTARIHFYWLSLLRQIRMPDISGLYPPQAEFFERAQAIDPSIEEWPSASAAGDVGGINRANPIGAWVFGHEVAAIPPEPDRLLLPTTVDGRAPTTDEDWWELGKLQRGAWDPTTGMLAAPAFAAARAYAMIRYSRYSPLGNAYGGFIAQPAAGSNCQDPDVSDDVGPPVNRLLHFTALKEDLADKDYETCVPGPNVSPLDLYDTHVAVVGYTPWAYYIIKWNGTVDELPTSDYLEGPYTGMPRLSKTPSGALERMQNAFAGEFRGAAQQAAFEQGEVPATWNAGAFDVQRFLASQYLLAPARGSQIGEDVQASYPVLAPGGNYPVNESCVVAGALIRHAAQPGPRRVRILAGSSVLGTATVQAAGSTIVWFKTPASAGDVVTIDADGGAGITAELAELCDYKPGIHDLFLALRLSGALQL